MERLCLIKDLKFKQDLQKVASQAFISGKTVILSLTSLCYKFQSTV